MAHVRKGELVHIQHLSRPGSMFAGFPAPCLCSPVHGIGHHPHPRSILLGNGFTTLPSHASVCRCLRTQVGESRWKAFDSSPAMPLQKLPPRDPSSHDQHTSKWQQMPHRRRTLQTISELAATDVPPPDLVSLLTAKRREELPNTGKKMIASSKRQTLPHHHPSAHSLDSDRYEAGWNARRARARAQNDPSSFADTSNALARTLQDESSHRQPAKTRRHSQSSLHSHSTHHQQLLRNSRSVSAFSPANDTESSGSPSTDSSSCHDSAVRRSQSGSSSDRSWTSSQTTRPMPIASPPPLPRCCTTSPVADYDYSHHSRIETRTRPSPGYRGTSHHTPDDIQRARLASLAALTAPPHSAPRPLQSQWQNRPQPSTRLYTATQHRHRHYRHHHYPRSSPPLTPRGSQRSRPLPGTHIASLPTHPHPPPQSPRPPHPHTTTHAHAHHRAKTEARVRRANEMERERERELTRTIGPSRSRIAHPDQDQEKSAEYDTSTGMGHEEGRGERRGVRWCKDGENTKRKIARSITGDAAGCFSAVLRRLRWTLGRMRRERRGKSC